ncbi:MAG: SOS-response transcriptional regulator UmuD-like protein [Vicingaceae bacterium]|nr:MAG: SOS-response transcriptional regulator UmuD-like protein [Vicingaceae bacterium]
MSIKLYEGSRLEIYSAMTDTVLERPFVGGGISAGFPSPAMDFEFDAIDLNRFLVKHPAATFYGRVKGNSLKNAGIDDGDILVIDRSMEPSHGKIAVCYINGEFTAKRIHISKGEVWLMPENEDYEPIKVEEGNELIIWGVVTYVIKAV